MNPEIKNKLPKEYWNLINLIQNGDIQLAEWAFRGLNQPITHFLVLLSIAKIGSDNFWFCLDSPKPILPYSKPKEIKMQFSEHEGVKTYGIPDNMGFDGVVSFVFRLEGIKNYRNGKKPAIYLICHFEYLNNYAISEPFKYSFKRGESPIKKEEAKTFFLEQAILHFTNLMNL